MNRPQLCSLVFLVIGVVCLVRLSEANPILPGFGQGSLPGIRDGEETGENNTQQSPEDLLPSSQHDTQIQDQQRMSNQEDQDLDQEPQDQGPDLGDRDSNGHSQQEQGEDTVNPEDYDQTHDRNSRHQIESGNQDQDEGNAEQQQEEREQGSDPVGELPDTDTLNNGISHTIRHHTSTSHPVAQEPNQQSENNDGKVSGEELNPHATDDDHNNHIHHNPGALPVQTGESTNITEPDLERGGGGLSDVTEGEEDKELTTPHTVTLREAMLPIVEGHNNTISDINHDNDMIVNYTETGFDTGQDEKHSTTKNPSDVEHILFPDGDSPDIIHGAIPSEQRENSSVSSSQRYKIGENLTMEHSRSRDLFTQSLVNVITDNAFHVLPTQTFPVYDSVADIHSGVSSTEIPPISVISSLTYGDYSEELLPSNYIPIRTFQHSDHVQTSFSFNNHHYTTYTPTLPDHQSNLVYETTEYELRAISSTDLHIPQGTTAIRQTQHISVVHSISPSFSSQSTITSETIFSINPSLSSDIRDNLSSVEPVTLGYSSSVLKNNVSQSIATIPVVSQGLVISDEDSTLGVTSRTRMMSERQTSGTMSNNSSSTYQSTNTNSSWYDKDSHVVTVTPPVVQNRSIIHNTTTTTSTKKATTINPVTMSKKLSRMSTKGAEKPSWITLSPFHLNRTNASSISAQSFTRPTVLKTTTKHKSIKTPNPAVYIIIDLQMKVSDFCSQKQMFVKELINVVQPNVQVEEKQVVVMNIGPDSEEAVTMDLYIQDSDGKVDISLTTDIYKYIRPGFKEKGESRFGKKLVDVKLQHTFPSDRDTGEKGDNSSSSKPETGIMIAIIIASVGGFCCICLLLLQIIIHKRQHGKRMISYIPGSGRLSIPNMDSIALGVVPKSRPNSGLWNPALEQEDQKEPSEPSHLLNYTALSNFTLDTDGQLKEFENLPMEMPRLSSVPVGAEDKNRFANVIPVPHTRVRLKKIPGEDNSEYINANYVRGYNNEHKVYIATQAPLQKTLNDFWRMVWEQQSRAILMLTAMDEQGQPRCIPYWPDSAGLDCRRQYGDYTVVLKKKEVQQEYTLSVLELKDIGTNLIREIHHFWYTSWPIDDIPEPISLVKFLLDTRPHYEDSGAPVIVHCCPGTGRTGSLIAIDTAMRSFEDKKKVDILNSVYKTRQDRAGAVQTCQQYILIYKSVFEYATVLNSPRVSVTSITNSLHHML